MKNSSLIYRSTIVGAGIALLGIATVALADYPTEVLKDGPIAYYRMNETFTVPAEKAVNSGSLGTVADGDYGGQSVTYSTVKQQPGALGEVDKAATFNGVNQGIRVPWSSAMNPNPPFSVEVWAKPATVRAQDSRVSPLASLRRASPAATGWVIYQNLGAWEFWMGDSNNNYTVQISGGGAPATNTWYHIVGTYDGSSAVLYVNGIEVARKDNETRYNANPVNALGIGQRGDDAFWFPGTVDEPAVYNTALTAAKVKAHYDAATTNPAGYSALVLADNPIGYWRLNEALVAYPAVANSGSAGATGDARYYGGTTSVSGPQAPAFPGFPAGNKAASFDGTNGYIGTPISLNNMSNVTLMGWVQTASTVTLDNRDGFIGQNDLAEFGWHNATTEFGMWTPGGGYATFPPVDITADAWHSIAAVMTGTNIMLYLDGLYKGKADGVVSSYGSNLFYVNIAGGGVLDGWGNFLKGTMDEVAIYNKVLSDGRIRTLHLTAAGDVNPPTLITDPPVISPDIVYATTSFRLDVDAYGAGPLSYQWKLEGTNLPGATSASYAVQNASDKNAGTYTVVVTNPNGSTTSMGAYVAVNPTVPVWISGQPRSQVRYEGGQAIFKVVADGTAPKYQWKRNGTNIPDATNATLVVSPVGSANTGTYTVTVSNPAGTQTSEPATLGIKAVVPGSFEALIVGLKPVAYWRFDETVPTAESVVAWDYMGGYDGEHSFNVETGVAGPRPPEFPGIEAGNRAARYEGTASGTTTGASLVNNRAQFSILGWFKPNGVQPQDRTALFGQNDVAEFGFHGRNDVGLWTPGGGYTAFSSSLVQTGKWYFITATADGNNMRLYLNGMQVASVAGVTQNYGSAGYGFNIGTAVLDATGNWFLGDIDDVAFFDRALTLQEIYAINSKATGVELKVSMSTVTNIYVEDTKPLGTPWVGRNNNATWLESSTDGIKTRTGVMQFQVASNSQVVIPYSSDLNTRQGTVSFWMKSAGTQGAGNEGAMLVDRRSSLGDVIVQIDGGGIFWQPEWTYNATTTATVSDDKWHHIAYVFDQLEGGAVSVYIDGVLDTTRANTRAWTWPEQQIELGRSHDGYWKIYEGLMDDVRFYSTQLTQPQIAQIAAGDSPVVAPESLLGRYNFDKPPGSGLSISWPIGVLESADSVAGPYTTVPGAVTPYVVNPTAAQKYYRIRL